MPDDFQTEFKQNQERIKSARLKMEEEHKQIGQADDRADKIMLSGCAGVVAFVAGLIIFGCWCVYHVLKTKGLVP